MTAAPLKKDCKGFIQEASRALASSKEKFSSDFNAFLPAFRHSLQKASQTQKLFYILVTDWVCCLLLHNLLLPQTKNASPRSLLECVLSIPAESEQIQRVLKSFLVLANMGPVANRLIGNIIIQRIKKILTSCPWIISFDQTCRCERQQLSSKCYH